MEIYDRPSVRATPPEGADAESRGSRDATVKGVSRGVRARLTTAGYGRLRKAHHQMLHRCLGWRKRKREDHVLSYASALLRTDSESVETTVRRRKILFAGFVARMGEERLPRRVIFGEMLGGKGYSGGLEWD